VASNCLGPDSVKVNAAAAPARAWRRQAGDWTTLNHTPSRQLLGP